MRKPNKIINELFYAGLTRKEYRLIQPAVSESNRKALVSLSLCTGLFWTISLLLSLHADAYRLCRAVFAGALLVSILILLCLFLTARRFRQVVFPLMYLFETALLASGIGIAFLQPDFRTATMIAIAVIVPSCFIDRTIIYVILEVMTILAFALLGKKLVVPEVYSWGMTNLIIFSLAGVLIGHINNKARFERYLYADRAEKLAAIQMSNAYHDQMTGLQNRRAFSERMEHLAREMPEELCVVMADVNGLKHMNDTCGHDAGDELLIGTAMCLTAAFGRTADIYRIGGDEFCIIITEDTGKTEACLKKLEAETEGWSGTYVKSISVSCGVCTKQEYADIDSIVKEADRRMYEQKNNYYITHGIDRRRS